MDRLLEIAPFSTWLRVLTAALAILAGIVAYGHSRMLSRAYGAPLRGPFSPTAPATWLRWAIILVATGIASWASELGWPVGVRAAPIALAAAVLAVDLFIRLRGGAADRT